ncbi:MAG: pyridoxamine 5'-phosphate oxidase family protein, partial [Anaeromyxobacteraceae bacterium]
MSTETVEATQALLRAERFGVLCTVQLARKPGWPMPSLAPYALTPRGEPLLALSALAQHTKNLLADPRAALYVEARGEGDPQERLRIAVLGRARAAAPEEAPALKALYLAAHPRERGPAPARGGKLRMAVLTMSTETVEATRALLRAERFGVLCTVQL